MKSDDGLLPANASTAMSTLRKSNAWATEALKVWAGIENFILCFCHKICFFLSLFARKNPKSLDLHSIVQYTATHFSQDNHCLHSKLLCNHQVDFSSLSSCDKHPVQQKYLNQANWDVESMAEFQQLSFYNQEVLLCTDLWNVHQTLIQRHATLHHVVDWYSLLSVVLELKLLICYTTHSQ